MRSKRHTAKPPETCARGARRSPPDAQRPRKPSATLTQYYSVYCGLFPVVPCCIFQNVVYKYPDLWICPYVRYGCDTWALEASCVDSAWMTEGGDPYAAFYPREKLDNLWETKTEELRIEAIPKQTNNFDDQGNKTDVSLETTVPAKTILFFFPCRLALIVFTTYCLGKSGGVVRALCARNNDETHPNPRRAYRWETCLIHMPCRKTQMTLRQLHAQYLHSRKNVSVEDVSVDTFRKTHRSAFHPPCRQSYRVFNSSTEETLARHCSFFVDRHIGTRTRAAKPMCLLKLIKSHHFRPQLPGSRGLPENSRLVLTIQGRNVE